MTILLGAAAAVVIVGVLVGIGWLRVRFFGGGMFGGDGFGYLLYEGFVAVAFAFFAVAILFALGMAVRTGFGGPS